MRPARPLTPARQHPSAPGSRRLALAFLWAAACALLSAGCGGSTRPMAAADLVAALPQPTPDPTVDAVVRGLPRASGGTAPAGSGPGAKAAAPTPTPAPRGDPSAPVARAAAASHPPASAPTKPRR